MSNSPCLLGVVTWYSAGFRVWSLASSSLRKRPTNVMACHSDPAELVMWQTFWSTVPLLNWRSTASSSKVVQFASSQYFTPSWPSNVVKHDQWSKHRMMYLQSSQQHEYKQHQTMPLGEALAAPRLLHPQGHSVGMRRGTWKLSQFHKTLQIPRLFKAAIDCWLPYGSTWHNKRTVPDAITASLNWTWPVGPSGATTARGKPSKSPTSWRLVRLRSDDLRWQHLHNGRANESQKIFHANHVWRLVNPSRLDSNCPR